MITEMKQWVEDVSKAYDMTAWGHTQRAAEILKQTRNRICAAIAEAEKQEPVAWAVFEGWNAHDLYLPQEYDEALKMAGYKGDHAEVKPLYTTPPAAQRQWVGLTDEDWKQLWAEFDSSGIENDFQDHMVSKYGAGHYTDADMYWQFQQQVIKQMVNDKLKEKNHE
jgi:hypothetical protein